MPFRWLVIGITALASNAVAQTVQTPAVPATATVQQLAPQLVNFAGSPLNFQSLVNGLSQGTPVQLVSVLPNGFTQLVTFTPTAPLPPAEIAGVLERARQQLISFGIGAPTSEQIAVTLMGGTVPTALGGAQVPGLLGARATTPQSGPSPAAQIQSAASAGGSVPGATQPVPSATQPPVAVQLIPSAALQPTPGLITTPGVVTPPAGVAPGVTARPNTSDSAIAPGATSASPIPLIPSNAPGVGSTPPSLERVPPGQPAARN